MMNKRVIVSAKVQIPSVFQKVSPTVTNTFTAPMTPHQPGALTKFSPSPSSQDSGFIISPLTNHSPHIPALPATNPFIQVTSQLPPKTLRREGCSIGPKLHKDDCCCVQDSRSSLQLQQVKKLPNTFTAKLALRTSENIPPQKHAEKTDNTEEHVVAHSIIVKTKELKTLKQLNKKQANTFKRYLSCGAAATTIGNTLGRSQKTMVQDSKNKHKEKKEAGPKIPPVLKIRASKMNTSMLFYLKHEVLLNHLRDFLTLKDYLAYLMVSKKIYQKKYVNKKLMHIILKGTLTQKIRRQYWAYKCNIQEIAKRSLHKFSYYSSKECPFVADIEKDLDRTFPKSHRFYSRPENMKRLGRVLRAFAVKNPDVGYIQGLNFIAGHLLLQFTDETSFWILEALINKYQLKDFLKESMPKLKLALYQMERLMQIHIPDIYNDLQDKEITCELFAVQWFVTLFSYDFEPPYLHTIWDLFLLKGWKFIFQLSLSILQQLSRVIAEFDYERLISCIKNSIRDAHFSQSLAIRNSLKIKVTNKELMLLQKEYETKNGTSPEKERRDTEERSTYVLPSPPMEEAAADLPLPFFTHTKPAETSRRLGFEIKEIKECTTECEFDQIEEIKIEATARNCRAQPRVVKYIVPKRKIGLRLEENRLKENDDSMHKSTVYQKIKEEYLLHQPSKIKYSASRSTTECLLLKGNSSKESCNISTSTLNSPGNKYAKLPHFIATKNQNCRKFGMSISANRTGIKGIKRPGQNNFETKTVGNELKARGNQWPAKRGPGLPARNVFSKVTIN